MGDETQDVVASLHTGRNRTAGAVAGAAATALLAALAGGTGVVRVSFGDDPASVACPPTSCPSAIEVRALEGRLAQEEGFRQIIGAKVESLARHEGALATAWQRQADEFQRLVGMLAETKDTVRRVELDAANRDKAAADAVDDARRALERDLLRLEGALDDLAKDMAAIRRKVR